MTIDKILDFVLHCDYFPICVDGGDNIDRNFELVYERLYRKKKTKIIAMSKEKDKNLIWFRLRQ
jgi:hypothetical protein